MFEIIYHMYIYPWPICIFLFLYTFWFDHGGFFEVGCAEPLTSFRMKWDE
jgi:hypothetical protein